MLADQQYLIVSAKIIIDKGLSSNGCPFSPGAERLNQFQARMFTQRAHLSSLFPLGTDDRNSSDTDQNSTPRGQLQDSQSPPDSRG